MGQTAFAQVIEPHQDYGEEKGCLRILLIEDNAAEAALIEELLAEVNNAPFELIAVKRLAQGLEYLNAEDLDVVLLDLSLPDSMGLETVVQVKTQAADIPIVVLTALNDGAVALEALREGAQDYLIKGNFEGDLLVRAIRYAIERQRDRKAIQQQVEREQLLARMLNRIRQSLELQEILQTTASEVQQFLKTNRVLIYCYQSQGIGEVVGEAVSASDYQIDAADVHHVARLACLFLPEVSWSGVMQDSAIELDTGYQPLLGAYKIEAALTIPIWKGEQAIAPPQVPNTSRLWGLLMVHHCSNPRIWQPWEVDCLNHLATQVAIAIQQSELYHQLELANQQLQQMVSIDSLTQLANRRRFDQVLQHEWRRLAREQKPVSLILFDIDFFKRYNDTYGHPAGDTCLQKVAGVINQGARRPTDLVARYGGEEFAAILPATDAAGAYAVAQEIRRHLANLQLLHAASSIGQYVTLSLGIATLIPNRDCSPDILVKAADDALYQAKAKGRDRIVHDRYRPDDEGAAIASDCAATKL